MNLVREQSAFLRDVGKMIEYAFSAGFTVTGGELERKKETQAAYVKTGRAETMDSPHLRRCAIELNFFREQNGEYALVYDFDSLRDVGRFWESLDGRNRWGGNTGALKDLPRFERSLSAAARAVPPPVFTAAAPAGAALELPPAPAPFAASPVSPVSPSFVAAPSPMAPATAAVVAGAGPNEGGSFARSIGPGSGDLRAVSLLQTLLKETGHLASIDGRYGPGTERSVRKFQADKGLKVDGSVGEKTWTMLIAAAPQVFSLISSRWIGEADFDTAAQRLACDGGSVRAVYEVESGGAGFLGLKPRILFEGHWFWQRLQAAGIDPHSVRAGNEDIVYQKWTKQFYQGGLTEYERLDRAIAIHPAAANESASWGLFQVMGLHWQMLGYASIDEFVAKMGDHEREHLLAFCGFLEHKTVQGKSLAQWLRERNWSTFALGYNGAGYRENRYDDRLAAAYQKHAH